MDKTSDRDQKYKFFLTTKKDKKNISAREGEQHVSSRAWRLLEWGLLQANC